MDLRHVSTVEDLEDCLSSPLPSDIECARRLEGDILVLGAGGKMGPTLVRRILRARRAAGRKWQVYACSRFSTPDLKKRLTSWGALTVTADLLAPGALETLPRCPHVIYLVGFKFGSTGSESRLWATNCYLAGRVAQQFGDSRIVALSTGNVYPLVKVESGGASEEEALDPVGEYAQSCAGRERMLEHFSRTQGTPMCILRLNYAAEARYGVLLDIARKVYQGDPLPLDMGYFNVIWQGDANSICFRCLEHCQSPPRVLNVTGAEISSVREVATQFGRLLGPEPRFKGKEKATALLSDASRSHRLLGAPTVPLEELIELVAGWVAKDGPVLGKPTRFELRDGKF